MTSDVAATKGEFAISIETLEDEEEDLWAQANWGFVIQDAGDDSLTTTATISSGIITATSCAGKYRVYAQPVGVPGISTYSDTITLTVTE